MRYVRIEATAILAARDAIREAAAAIGRGGLVVLPTDTLYGLAADPHQPGAVARLFALKRRPLTQPVPLVAGDLAQVEARAGRLDARAGRLAAAFWPGPLTLIVPAWPGLAPGVDGGTGGVGIRVPDHAVARAVSRVAGTPLVATSANLSGEPAPRDARDLAAAVAGGVDLVLDAGPTPGGPASTIVDTRGDRVVLVRPGAVPWERVLEFA